MFLIFLSFGYSVLLIFIGLCCVFNFSERAVIYF
jgi:hypothetical protein